MNSYYVTTFYRFLALSETEKIRIQIEDFAEDHGMLGLVILGAEGINATVSAKNAESLKQFKEFIQMQLGTKELFFKDSETQSPPFRRFLVKLRSEIVTLGAPGLVPEQTQNHHLSPQEWNRVLKEETDFVMLDTRNWYETKIGTFKGAVDPHIERFTEFPEFVEKQNYPKDKKMLIFCTGGIRCEKGILELQKRGYSNVFQLEGGILNYLKEYPRDQFEGECFVFDLRVAVDQELQASKRYKLCPHCGQPAETEIQCQRCDTKTCICEACYKEERTQAACSKHCAHQLTLHPKRRGPKQTPEYLRPGGLIKRRRQAVPVENKAT